jgi:hypothetical protein
VTRYMADRDLQSSAFPALARDIFETVHGRSSATSASLPPVATPPP